MVKEKSKKTDVTVEQVENYYQNMISHQDEEILRLKQHIVDLSTNSEKEKEERFRILSEKNIEIDRINAQIKQREQEQKEFLHNQRISHEKQITELTSSTKKEREALRVEMDKLKETHYQETADSKKDVIEKFSREREAITNKYKIIIHSLEEEHIDQMKRMENNISTLRKESQDEISDLQHANVSLKRDLAYANKSLLVEREQFAEYKQSKQQDIDRMVIKHEEITESLKKQHESTKDYIKGLKSEINTHLDTIKELTTERNILSRTSESQQISAENRITKLSRECKILTERYTIKEEEMKMLHQQELNELTRELELLRREQSIESDVNNQNEKLQRMLKDMQTEYTQLQNEFKTKNDRIAKLQEQMALLGEHEVNTRTQLSGAKNKMANMLKQQVHYKSVVTENGKVIEALTKSVEEIKAEKDVLFNQYQKLLKSTQDTLQSEHRNTEGLRKEVALLTDIQRKYQLLVEDHNLSTGDLQTLRAKHKTLGEAYEKLKGEYQRIDTLCIQLTEERDKINRDHTAAQGNLKMSLNKVNQHRDEVETLKQHVQLIEKDMAEKKDLIKSISQERDELFRLHAIARERMTKYELDHEKIIRERDDARAKFDNGNEITNNIAGTNLELKKRLEVCNQQIQHHSKEAENQRVLVASTKKQLESLDTLSKNQIKLLTEKVQRVAQELAEKQAYIAETDKLVESLTLERRTTASLTAEKDALSKDIHQYKINRDAEMKRYKEQERFYQETIHEMTIREENHKKEKLVSKETEGQNKALTHRVEELKTVVSSLEQFKYKYITLTEEHKQLQEEYNSVTTKMGKVSSQFQTVQNTQTKESKQLTELQERYTKLETEYKDCNQRYKAMIHTQSILEKEFGEAKQLIDALRITIKKYEQQQRCIDTLQQDKETLQKKHSDLQRQHANLVQTHSDYTIAFKDSSKTSEENIKKIFQLEEILEKREEELRQKSLMDTEKTKQYEQFVRNAQEKIKTQENEIEQFRSMNMDNKRLHQQNQEIDSNLTKLQAKYDMLGTVLKDTQKSFAQEQQKSEQLTREHEEGKKMMHRTLRDRESTIEHYKIQIDKSNVRVNELTEMHRELTDKYNTLFKNTSHLQQTIASIILEKKEFSTSIDDLRDDNKQLRDKVEQAKEIHIQYKEAQISITRHLQTIHDLKTQIAKKMSEPPIMVDTTRFDQQMAKMKAEIDNERAMFYRDRANFQKTIDEAKSRIKQLEARIRELELALKHAPVREMYTKLEEEHQELSLFKIDMLRKYQLALQRMEELKKTIHTLEKNESDTKELYTKIAELEHEKNKLQKECVTFQQTVPNLTEQVEKHNARYEALKAENTKHLATIEKLQGVPKQLDVKVKQLREESIRTIHKYIQLQKDATTSKEVTETKMKEITEKNNLLELTLEQAKMDVEHFTHIKNELKQNYNLSIEQVFTQVQDLKRILEKKELRVKELEGMLSMFTAKTLDIN